MFSSEESHQNGFNIIKTAVSDCGCVEKTYEHNLYIYTLHSLELCVVHRENNATYLATNNTGTNSKISDFGEINATTQTTPAGIGDSRFFFKKMKQNRHLHYKIKNML